MYIYYIMMISKKFISVNPFYLLLLFISSSVVNCLQSVVLLSRLIFNYRCIAALLSSSVGSAAAAHQLVATATHVRRCWRDYSSDVDIATGGAAAIDIVVVVIITANAGSAVYFAHRSFAQ